MKITRKQRRLINKVNKLATAISHQRGDEVNVVTHITTLGGGFGVELYNRAGEKLYDVIIILQTVERSINQLKELISTLEVVLMFGVQPLELLSLEWR